MYQESNKIIDKPKQLNAWLTLYWDYNEVMCAYEWRVVFKVKHKCESIFIEQYIWM